MNRAMIQALDEVSRSNSIDKNELLHELEEALYGAFLQAHPDLWIDGVKVHPKTGDTEVLFEETWVEQDFSTGELGRMSAAAVRRALNKVLNRHQHEMTVEHYEPRIGETVLGRVEHSDRRGSLIKLSGGVEAWLPARNRPRTERLQRGKQYSFVITGVHERGGRGEVELSRTHENFLSGMLALHVPEVESGLIRVIGSARIPGVRSLVVLQGEDGIAVVPNIKGVGNSRIRSIAGEFPMTRVKGQDPVSERFDFAVWHEDAAPEDKIRALMLPVRPARIEYDLNDDGEFGEVTLYVYEDDFNHALVQSELAGQVLNIAVDVKLAQQEATDKSARRKRDVGKAAQLTAQCEYVNVRGKQCVNAATNGTRCQLHPL